MHMTVNDEVPVVRGRKLSRAVIFAPTDRRSSCVVHFSRSSLSQKRHSVVGGGGGGGGC